MKEYALFLGCLIPARLPFLENISIKVLEKFDIMVKPMNGASCCPDPIVMESFDNRAWLTIAARNLSIAEEMKCDILTLCDGCFSTLFRVNRILGRDSRLRRSVNNTLSKINRSFIGAIKVKHVAQVVHDIGAERVEGQVRMQLQNLRIAPHQGCHLVRPSKVLNEDNPTHPAILNDIISWVGARPVDYSLETSCCGAGIKEIDPNLNLMMLNEKLKSIREADADCIMTPCPFCFIQFDLGQKEVNREFKGSYDFPVFYVTELLGLALGFSPKEVGLEFHRIKTKMFRT